jgi:CRISPR-associated endonuclease/helicase Cas3
MNAPDPPADFADLFRRATDGESPFDWQRRLAVAPTMPQVVRVATGAGKTEGAVLSWLWRRRHAEPEVRQATPRRLVYCLPMRTLVEQTVARITEQLARVAPGVRVYQLMGGAVQHDWIDRPEDDAALVGTLDQLLSRALMRGYGESRFRWPIDYGLLHTDAHWVYDEVQLFGEALPTSTQLQGLRDTLRAAPRPTTSLWMSATVDPAWLGTVDHAAPADVLQLTEADRTGPLGTRLRAVKTLQALDRLDAAVVSAEHRPGTLTLCVVNTVATARELAGRLRKAAKGVEIVLLHSRFRPPDRRRLSGLLSAPLPETGRIVVATQVVEAGVDISAATLFTEVAPWASLVQRFGRCNRRGEIEGARVLWAHPAKAPPYTEQELDEARAFLGALDGRSVGPDALEEAGFELTPPPTRHVLRRRDFLGLFDTAPDLSGSDVDISRFVRDSDEVTCTLAWRPGALTRPPDDTVLARDELCPVALGELARAQKSRDAIPVWRFDHIDGQWTRVPPGAARPGDRLLTDASFGCYTAEGGFDPTTKGSVAPVDDVVRVDEDEAIDDDPTVRNAGVWLSLAEHSQGVCAELETLLAAFPELDDAERRALRTAAALHDWGKAHRVFQEALVDDSLPDGLAGVAVAKRPGRGRRYARRGFRHELASVLAYLGGDDEPDPLVAYLIASHHGRVRMGARSLPGEDIAAGEPSVLGCREGDVLPAVRLGPDHAPPEVTLSLAPLRLGSDGGPTYTDLALDALDRLGPVRLGFLEALMRTADRRRSAREQEISDA